jgi:KaiC/GvpD/RAD55 family RecA-like ATPase
MMISGYLTWYLRSYLPDSTETFVKLFGVDPAYYFAGVDQKIVRHIVTCNGLGDWASFTSQNADVIKRLEELNGQIADVDFTDVNLRTWRDAVKKDQQTREGYNILSQVKKLLDAGDGETALAFMEQHSGRLLHRVDAQAQSTLQTSVPEAIAIIRGFRTGDNNLKVPTHHREFDKAFRGWTRGAVNGLVGVPGCGKTTLMEQITFAAARKGVTSVWIQTEMERWEMLLKEAVRRSNVSLESMENHAGIMQDVAVLENDLKTAPDNQIERIHKDIASLLKNELPTEAWRAVESQLAALEKLPVDIYTDANVNVLQIIQRMRETERRFGKVDYLVIDHLGMISMLSGDTQRSGDWYKNMIIEIKQYIPRLFPHTAIVVLQHMNTRFIDSKASGEDDNVHLIPDMGDIEGQTARAYHQAFVVIRPEQHKRQLSSVFGKEAWEKLTDEEKNDWLTRCDITPVKNRMGNSNRVLTCRYVGKLFAFKGI